MKHKISEIQVSYNTAIKNKITVTDSSIAFNALLNTWNINTIELQEEFKVLLLNRANIILGVYPLSKGGVTSTVVDLKLLFAVTLKCNASGIILSHNHPSGNLQPSELDKEITERIKKISKILDIIVLDHLIISKDTFYSFAENGLL